MHDNIKELGIIPASPPPAAASESRRPTLERIVRSAIAAVSPRQAVQRTVKLDGDILTVAGRAYNLNDYNRVRLLGAGKAAAPMAEALEEILGDRLYDGLIVVKYGHTLELKHTELLEAAHPVPDEAGVKGANALLERAEACGAKDLVLFMLSGGASALIPAPRPPVTLDMTQQLTQALLDCGASIDEVNALRKHVSLIKGGGLARALHPATTETLIISDVVGDRLDVIGSGPTAPDQSSYRRCLDIVGKYGITDRLPKEVNNLLRQGAAGEQPETCKEHEHCFTTVRNTIVASNRMALDQAAAAAKEAGYTPVILTSHLQGEAREAAQVMVAMLRDVCTGHGIAKAPCCLLFGGETTVTIRGTGKGGRNQEMALAAGLALEGVPECQGRVSLVCAGTDGNDGPTDAAGALVLPETLAHAKSMGADPVAYLANNDAYAFFKQTGTLLLTGPTLTNVMDVAVFLVD